MLIEMSAEDRERICQEYRKKTEEKLEEWHDEKDANQNSANTEEAENDEIDGFKRNFFKLLGNIRGNAPNSKPSKTSEPQDSLKVINM